MYGVVSDGEPFRVFARREGTSNESLVLKFECNEGMGILGIRKVGRTDPAPCPHYEEDDIDPTSLRAGRFVHVLASGQRQSYALSRMSPDLATRLPIDRWVELTPHTEYGFRYLVAPDEALVSTTAAVSASVAMPSAGPPAAPQPAAAVAAVAAVAIAGASVAVAPAPRPSNPPSSDPRPSRGPLPAAQTPMAPPIAEAALNAMTKEVAVEHLKAEMLKVHTLQQAVNEMESELRRSRGREKDLLEVLARWQSS